MIEAFTEAEENLIERYDTGESYPKTWMMVNLLVSKIAQQHEQIVALTQRVEALESSKPDLSTGVVQTG